ncbi:hypothetical protein BVI434_1940030 [Burkholderia vietnamiensis]|nr:hypothetical protein BVI434_1940030 [Burkholderia vietnamiensis]
MARGHAVQPDRLFDQRLSLVVLRAGRRARVDQPRSDLAVPRDPARDRRVDVPHRLQAEELTRAGRGIAPVRGEKLRC